MGEGRRRAVLRRGVARRLEAGEGMARKVRNNVQQLREDLLLSKAELARRAGLSPLTIDRVERGEACRLDTKRKIILALGLPVQEKNRVFGERGNVVAARRRK